MGKRAKQVLFSAVLVAASALVSSAVAQPPGQPTARSVQLRGRSLGTITVTGNQLQALQQIKQALHRVHSLRAADADDLVCTTAPVGGSHINKTLSCETNRQWWRREEAQAVQMNIAMMTMQGGGGLVAALQSLKGRNSAFAVTLNYSRFRALMNALPAADEAVAGSE